MTASVSSPIGVVPSSSMVSASANRGQQRLVARERRPPPETPSRITSRRDADRPPDSTSPKSCTTTSGNGRPRRASRFHHPTAATASAAVGPPELRVPQRRQLAPELPVIAAFVRHPARLHHLTTVVPRTASALPCYDRWCTRSEECPCALEFDSDHCRFLLAASLAALTCDDAPPDVPLALQVAKAFCAHQFACCSPFELSDGDA